jgi:pimeloyl-ACP methyl ester carboxylesterase
MRVGKSLAVAGALFASVGLSAVARANGNPGHVIKSHEHEAERAGVKIAIYEKWSASEESKFRANGKVILLVHGATWSSKCTFDPMPGYSFMDSLADAGYDVFALDLHGYGKSGKTDRDMTESPSAAEDIDAAVDYIRAFRWVEKVHVFGYQWGAQPAGIFAMKHAKKVGKLVLFGMRHNTLERTGEPNGPFRLNGTQVAMLKPDEGDLDPEFVRRRAQVCMAEDPQSPNGALRDMARKSFVDPVKVAAPTLLVMGDRGETNEIVSDRLEFYKMLASHTKWFVTLSGLGKYAPVERGRARFESAVLSFLDQP